MNTHTSGRRRLQGRLGTLLKAKALVLTLALSHFAGAQTKHFMSSGDFSENFDDIADPAAWPNGFLSSEPWAPVAIDANGVIPSATRITASTAAFAATASSSGVHRGTANIQLLSTGSTNNSSSVAIDLLLDFTNRISGTLSFDAASVINSTGNRDGTLRAYFTTDGTTWTELAGGGLPFVATNNVTASAAVSVALPAALNGAASARFRFYYHNSASPSGSPSGSRPKISIDNLTVTSTASGADTTKPALVSLLPAAGEPAAPIASPLTITFSEPVVAGAGNVTLYAASAPSTPVQTFAASSGNFQGASVTFTPSAALAYEAAYFVTVNATAFADPSGNTFDGILSSGGWAFTTAAEPSPTPPLIVSVTPDFDAVDVPLGNVVLEIEYDTDVLRGTGTLNVFDIDDLDFPPTPVATYDVSDPGQVAISGKVVTFLSPVPATAGKTYYIEAPAGLFLSVAGSVNSQGFGFGASDVYWGFQMITPDVTPPAITSTSPQNGPGAAAVSVLRATYNEIVTLGTGPWTITVFDVTAGQNVAVFDETDVASVAAAGAQLSITLPQSLLFFNQYRVTLSEGVVKDTAGNSSAPVTGSGWEFTTGAPFSAGQVVISQAYGGGGNASAQFTNDYVELYNRSSSPVSLSG